MRVVVGLDLNLHGFEWLLDRAVAFVRRTEGSLDLVFVGEGEARQAQLVELLDTVPSSLRGEARMLQGDPATVLIELTNTYDAIVLGPREPQGIDRLFQNAMAVRVLRQSRCPVFVPRTDRFGDHRPRILVGIHQASDKLDYVLHQTGRWARALDAEVDLVEAIPRSLPPVRRPNLKEALEREWHETHASTLTTLEALLERLDQPLRGTAAIAPGEAEDVLVDRSADYDLLIVGNRDRRGLERFLLGGVARVVVVRAACDVLILPTQFAE